MKPTKRLFDVLFSGLGLLVLSPLLLVLALLIRLSDGGPAFFRQDRVGYGGRVFRLWKFRTMVVGAERRGGQLTVEGDDRITRLGRHLRRLKWDELPQLLNVLRGEMSLVGPRPEVVRYVALYSEEERRVLDLVPGITDPASIRYRDEERVLACCSDPERTYVESIMPEKIRLNLQYAVRATAWSDLVVILRTLGLLVGSGRTESG
jgi:lipopolysaccharide/colanic/teichoic acid biosynthesis glycosyltransferase